MSGRGARHPNPRQDHHHRLCAQMAQAVAQCVQNLFKSLMDGNEPITERRAYAIQVDIYPPRTLLSGPDGNPADYSHATVKARPLNDDELEDDPRNEPPEGVSS